MTEKPQEILVIVFVKYRDTFLILRKSEKALYHKGLWSTIQFSATDDQNLRQAIVDEVTGTLSIEENHIKDVIRWGAYTFQNTEKMYYVVKIDTPFVEPSWEYDAHEWIQFRSIGTFETVPNFKEDLERVKNL